MSAAAAATAEDRLLGLRREHIQRYSTLVVLVVMFSSALTVDRFLTAQNLLNIAQQIRC